MGRYERALVRNLNEVGFAIFKRKALEGLEAADPLLVGVDFFRLAYFALYNDMIAHAIKVLDKDSKSASFWYIYRSQTNEVESYAKKKGHDLASLKALVAPLKSIRNKTHFHIDKGAVVDPKSVWQSADIARNQLSQALDTILAILQHLHESRFGKKFPLQEYDGTDATKVVEAAQNAGIIPNNMS